MTIPAEPARHDLSDDLDEALWDGRGIVHTPDGPVTGEDDWG